MKSSLMALAFSTSILGFIPAAAALAQDAPPPVPPNGDIATVPSIDEIHMREQRDRLRIDNAMAAGDMSANEAHRVAEELANIRTQEAELAHRDGPDLNPTDRQFINDRLNQLGQSIHWIRVRNEDRW
jgi:polyhydroxyalkanoate synthesis regulator phasin